jgi:hypothetical protein
MCVGQTCMWALLLATLRFSLSIFAFTDGLCSTIRLARREKSQGRFNQKKEEAQNTMRERSSAYKEKEKVSPICFPIPSSANPVLSSRTGNNGHVPATGEAKIRIMLTGRQEALLL